MVQGRPLYICPLVSFFFYLSCFPRLPYFCRWCGLSANLECRSEMCYTRLAGNTGRKNDAKNRHLGSIAQFCWAVSLQLRHISTIGKTFKAAMPPPHVLVIYGGVDFGRLTADIGSGVWGTPANFNGGFESWQRYGTASSSGR